jgi:ornithine decarboxylase
MNPFDLPIKRIEELVEEHGTPLYIVSKSKLIENFNRLNNALPAANLFYAVKANPHEGILEILHEAGADFDVASKGEIIAAIKAGANPEKDLIFADTVKIPKQIAFADGVGVDDFTYDNESEIIKLAKHAPNAKVHLRIAVSNKGSVAQLSKKFGAKPEDAMYLLEKAKKAGLRPDGISFHVGSQCLDSSRYVEALNTTKEIFVEAEKRGMKLNQVDIGGGFPVKYINEEINIEKMCEIITSTYNKLFDESVRLVAEPGRSIVGDAMISVTEVVGESVRNDKNWLYLDDGLFGSFLEVFLYNMKFPMKTNTTGPLNKYILAGPTCDCIDVISRDENGKECEVELPKMKMYDLLIAGSMGAYTFSESTRFNGHEPPKFVYIE